MARPLQLLREALRRFGRNRRGVAAVEFALVAPVLILLYFGTVEAASLYTVDRKVTVVTATLGDLVSRADGSIATTTLNDYFQAASSILNPYPQAGLKQVVTVLGVTSTGSIKFCWSRATGTGAVARTSYTLPATTQINKLARGGYLVVSEVSYPYLPLYGMVISSSVSLSHVEYYLPRFASYIAISGAATCTL